ncbi:CDP-alcohol phosphatidyltransferase family protein [Nesterenkonia populi]|uniref:CDP-alcohol phosphatidyltransferase family protein n=1 Tax=Nesterenkonia populi TaxID=1591087 RepID=UPI0011BF9076|nr:CDP-alcohol phosphatidyltransferase family protein [Nesterenkonia populi]
MRLIGAGTRDGFEYTVRETFWTAPNIVTVLRFLLVPLFVWFVHDGAYMAAFWTLVVLGVTDWVDGFVARAFDQISTVGLWLDPLADRVAMIIIALTLVGYGVVPVWVLWTILIADALLLVTGLSLFRGSPQLKVSPVGKVRTALVMLAFPLSLLVPAERFDTDVLPFIVESALLAACVLHAVACLDYIWQLWAKFLRLRRQGISSWDRSAWVVPATAPIQIVDPEDLIDPEDLEPVDPAVLYPGAVPEAQAGETAPRRASTP